MDTLLLKIDEQLSLHHPNEEWASSLFALIDQQRTYLGQWLNWVDQTNAVSDTQKFLKEEMAFNRYGQKLTVFLFWEQRLIGSVAFIRFDKINFSTEMGYWIDKNFQGKGLMTKACKALIQYGFNKTKLNRIEMKIAKENLKSKAIAQRLGFEHEGCLKQAIYRNEQFHDLDIFGLLKPKNQIS